MSQPPPRVYPRVIIVGGGLGGLMLGILLDKMGVPYHIFERNHGINPVGALMSLNGNILAVFDQLGLLEETMKISLASVNSSLFTEKLEKITDIDFRSHFENTGYKFIMFSRPELYAILYSKIHPTRISFGKRVLSTRRQASGVQIWTVVTIPGNRFCWSVMAQIANQADAKERRFRNSETGPEANQGIIGAVQDFPVTFGGKLGEIIDATPKDKISKVLLEEKLFETWYHGDIVLLGDGGLNAMQDAVILANSIYDLVDLRPECITAAFRDYKDQRYPHAKRQVANSRINAKISSGQTRTDRVVRHMVLNFLPRSIQNKQFSKDSAYRPQCTFLERVPDKGSVPSLPQRASWRYEAEKRVAAAASAEKLRDSGIKVEYSSASLPLSLSSSSSLSSSLSGRSSSSTRKISLTGWTRKYSNARTV
ncbi:hypothetical protein BGX24_002746 [Mortierella sp. AD032]|nr:hypothetical protein BGX24_002746 [Mortierella sp. AD032]